jgi:hypothetical protein
MRGATCTALNSRGERCGSWPVHGGELCFWHDPASAEEAAEARRVGGHHRRRERVIAGAYDIGDVGTTAGLMRVLSIALTGLLQQPNSIARDRALLYLVMVGGRLLETQDLERLEALEGGVAGRPTPIRRGRMP